MQYTVAKIRAEMNEAGSHWWDFDTMVFFRSRVAERVYQGEGGIYFVSSEQYSDDSPRLYTVRQYFPLAARIDTVGVFNVLPEDEAIALAEELAAMPLDDQFTEAMAALDKRVTGDCRTKATHQTCYGSVADAAECDSRSIIYLSDGGYTRLMPHRYEDGDHRFYLRLIPTGTDDHNAAVSALFDGAIKTQREICRILFAHVSR